MTAKPRSKTRQEALAGRWPKHLGRLRETCGNVRRRGWSPSCPAGESAIDALVVVMG